MRDAACAMKSLSVRISEQFDRRLTREAARRGMSKSALVREVLERFLPGSNTDGPPFFDLAHDLLGKRSGPGDLSTNREYMEGFGK